MNDRPVETDRYLILIEGGPPSNYSAWSPDLPGCVAAGDTIERVERRMGGLGWRSTVEGDSLHLPNPLGGALNVHRY